MFRVYNEDGSVYSSISLKNDTMEIEGIRYALSDFEGKRKEIAKAHQFSPFNFYPSSGYVLQFAYKGIENGKVRIFINGDKGITKLLKVEDGLFAIEPWQKYLEGSIVEFDPGKNPLLEEGKNSSGKIETDINIADSFFSVIEVKGDFRRIECTDFCDFKCIGKAEGWIKWRDGNSLLIKFVSAC